MSSPLVLVLASALLAGPVTGERTVHVDRGADPRLEQVAALVTAELATGGFAIVAAPATATVTLRMDADRAFVAAYVANVDETFVTETASITGEGGMRAAERAAVQVTEWLIAVWPPPRATAPPVVARLLPPSAPHAPAVATAAPTRPRPPVPATIETSPAPPAGVARRAAMDVGFSTLRAPGVGMCYGGEIGLTLQWAPVRRDMAPFARVALGLPWFGGDLIHLNSGESIEIHYATATLTVGLEKPLIDQLSIEASAAAGLALLAFAVSMNDIAVFSDPVVSGSTGGAGPTLLATLGGHAGLVHHITERWALLVEGRADWFLPRPVFVAGGNRIGDSAWPAFGVAVAIRSTF